MQITSKKNVYLIDLASGSNMNLLPLSIGLVGSYSMEIPEISEVYDFHFQFLRGNLEEKLQEMENPAVIGLACYIWNYRGSLKLARLAKERFPEAQIVLGGFSIPKAPDRVSLFFKENPYVDILVHGEGEVIFANLLRQLADRRDLTKVPGITFKTNDIAAGFVTNINENRIIDLDTIPSPFLNGLFDKVMTRYGPSITGALWETNRGCPYSCTFCDWGNADVNKVKKYDMDRLKAELEWVSKQDFFYMFISDANFGIFKDRDMEIAGWLADHCEQLGSPRHVVTNWAKNKHKQIIDIADRMARGGLACNITLAVQSNHEPTLEAIKRKNIKHSEMLNLKKALHDRNIPTYMEVILGLPEESYETFVLGLNECLTPRLSDRFFVYLCQLLENTELASTESREKYKIESRTCWHTVSNRKFEAMEDSEVEEFIVGNSTLPQRDWGNAYLVGYLLTVFYNHRVMFFVMNYLHQQFGLKHTDFIEFVLDAWRRDASAYPQMTRGIDHLDKQRQLILDGDSYMSGMEGYPDLIMLPAAAAVSLMVSGVDALYDEARQLVEQFMRERGLAIDDRALGDVLSYQRARMPSWPIPEGSHYTFGTNVPEYFELLTAGMEPPPIVDKKLTLTVEDHNRSPSDFAEFAATLVRGSLAVDLLDVKIDEGWLQPDHQDTLIWLEERRKERRRIEQESINKLKKEFEKLRSGKDAGSASAVIPNDANAPSERIEI